MLSVSSGLQQLLAGPLQAKPGRIDSRYKVVRHATSSCSSGVLSEVRWGLRIAHCAHESMTSQGPPPTSVAMLLHCDRIGDGGLDGLIWEMAEEEEEEEPSESFEIPLDSGEIVGAANHFYIGETEDDAPRPAPLLLVPAWVILYLD